MFTKENNKNARNQVEGVAQRPDCNGVGFAAVVIKRCVECLRSAWIRAESCVTAYEWFDINETFQGIGPLRWLQGQASVGDYSALCRAGSR